jgi:hypothetical protein
MDNPLMQATPGLTYPNITKEPLGDEGELTPGPDDLNPFEDPEAAERIQALQQKREMQRAEQGEIVRTVPKDFEVVAVADPTEGDDPYVFDDVGAVVDDVSLPGVANLGDGPQF